MGINQDAQTVVHVDNIKTGERLNFPKVNGNIVGVRLSNSETKIAFYVQSHDERLSGCCNCSDFFFRSMCFESVEVYKLFRTEAKKVLEKGGLRTPCPCLDLYQENVLTEY